LDRVEGMRPFLNHVAEALGFLICHFGHPVGSIAG
jgi:hypothetical protein